MSADKTLVQVLSCIGDVKKGIDLETKILINTRNCRSTLSASSSERRINRFAL